MSELINNKEFRQNILKNLIRELHEGGDIEGVKAKFEKEFKDITTAEITEMEQALIQEGMKVEEIQKLCDVHASIFKGSIEEIHREIKLEESEGHPVYTFKAENKAIENHINENIIIHLKEFEIEDNNVNLLNLIGDFNLLWDIDKHYSRKENALFPLLEKYEITAPPKVMWGVDDEIRKDIKQIKTLLKNYNKDNHKKVIDNIREVVKNINDMIFKEDSILFPLALDTLDENDWTMVYLDSDEIGYCMVEPSKWVQSENIQKKSETIDMNNKIDEENELKEGYIKMNTGILSFDQVSTIFNTLPFDVTFVDKDGIVKYFSEGKERVFPRTKAIIGREVKNCHPPTSVHIVEKIVEDLKSGKKDNEDFWIKMGDKYVYIRYFAVRNEKREFLGVLEVTQNIKPIQELTGEKRLASK
ncbi:MAG: DUF438 domain-containing protein [Clostridiaceae bacterium]